MNTRKDGYEFLHDVTGSNVVDRKSVRDVCPRVTRSRLLCGFALIAIVALVLVYQCVGSDVATLCCHGARGAAAGTQAVVTAAAAAAGDSRDHNAPQESQRYPQVIIIGVRKGGTRALLEFLNLHPQIVAEKREMHFFDQDDTYRRGLRWYRQQMPWTTPGQITIEKTPAYFNVETVPRRVYHMNRTCKFLLVVRDPTERAISDYTQIYFNKKAKGKPLHSFEELAIADIYGTVNKSYKAIRRSMYYKHMDRWLRFFPLEQFHVVDGERFVQEPASELRLVEKFMGVDHLLSADRFYYNSTRGFYCMKLLTKEKCLAKSKGRIHPYVDPKVIKILRKFFKPLNQKFYSIINRSFDWPEE